MTDNPPFGPESGASSDSDLLARLNALRPTSISLEHTGSHLSIPSTQQTPETLLSDRLRALRNGGARSKSSGSALPGEDHMASAILSDASEQTASAISKLQTPIVKVDDRADTQLARDALDFARTRSHDACTARFPRRSPQAGSKAPSPEEVIERLRNYAVGGLSKSDKVLKSNGASIVSKKTGSEGDSETDESSADEANTEEAEGEDEDRNLDEETREAEEALARLLDEASLEDREEAEREEQPRTNDKHSESQRPPSATDEPLALPSTPSDLREPPDPPDSDPETLAFTTSIAARMAALQQPSASTPSIDSLGMPSAPTTRPVSPPRNYTPAKLEPEPPSSCVICYDTASVLCCDCEDNFGNAEEALYCERCWREGHLGADAGIEERAHKWIKLRRPK